MEAQKIKQRRKNFFDSLRQYSKKHRANRNFSDKYADVEEDGSIRIAVNCEDGALSTVSNGNDLTDDVISHIETTAYYIPIDRQLNICFSSVAENDRDKVERAYRKYFELKLNDKCLDLRICLFKSMILLMIGFAFLALSILVSRYDILWGLNEIFAVVASFTMWESVDFFLLERANIKAEKLDAAQLLLSKITFE